MFTRTNSPELVGKSAQYLGLPHPCSFASYLIRVRLSQGYLPTLLNAVINSPYGRKWVKAVVTQQVGQANVNGTKLQALAVPVPPIAEQQRIVAEIERCLSIVLRVEVQLEANMKRAKRFREALLAATFDGGTGDA